MFYEIEQKKLNQGIIDVMQYFLTFPNPTTNTSLKLKEKLTHTLKEVVSFCSSPSCSSDDEVTVPCCAVRMFIIIDITFS